MIHGLKEIGRPDMPQVLNFVDTEGSDSIVTLLRTLVGYILDVKIDQGYESHGCCQRYQHCQYRQNPQNESPHVVRNTFREF